MQIVIYTAWITLSLTGQRDSHKASIFLLFVVNFFTLQRISVLSKCSNLVDPASSHMLVSKIKPCMSKFTLSHGETANGSLNQSRFLRWHDPTWITVAILELIHAIEAPTFIGKSAFISSKPIGAASQGVASSHLVTLDNFVLIAWPRAGDASFKCLPYQMSMVRDMPTMFVTGNGESGFDSGEGAWETATTSKEGSRRANYPILTQGGSDSK